MTAPAQTEEDQTPAVERLLALSADDFRQLLEGAIDSREHPQLWAAALDPRVVRRTRATLQVTHQDLLAQLAQRADDVETGADKAEYRDWRRRALGYLRIVSKRLSEAKYAASNARPVRNEQKRARLTNAVFELAQAIREHREACEEAGITPEEHDLELWDALDRVEVRAGDGPVSVGQWVDEITSRPDFERGDAP